MKFAPMIGLIIGIAAAAVAHAGTALNFNVTVDTLNRVASGAMAAARFSTDSSQFIDCAASNDIQGICTFRSADSVVGQCVTTSQPLINMIRSIDNESFVMISWDTNAVCTYIGVKKASFLKP